MICKWYKQVRRIFTNTIVVWTKAAPKRIHILFYLILCSLSPCAQAAKPNIVFISVDDLRTQLGCYGYSQMKTPNIDRLANSGVLFSRAYCQIPVCGASRASLLTGLRPAYNRFVDYNIKAENEVPGTVPLMQHLRQNGYYSIGCGEKIFHFSSDFKEKSWDEWLGFNGRNFFQTSYWGKKEVADNYYGNGDAADKAINAIKRFKAIGKPVFLGIGFMKPHLPFTAPSKYWDMYTLADVKFAPNNFIPDNCITGVRWPNNPIHSAPELTAYTNISARDLGKREVQEKLILGYYACVSYTDAMIGKVLDELDRQGLRDNTIVIVTGDHGWFLGEHTLWTKHMVWEDAAKAPLIISGPGVLEGIKVSSIVEFLDIYPTLCDLSGISKPSHLQGVSLKPLLTHINTAWDRFACTRWHDIATIRTNRYRYWEWRGSDKKMLFDLVKDPLENDNIAGNSQYVHVIQDLSTKLQNVESGHRPDFPQITYDEPSRISVNRDDSLSHQLASIWVGKRLRIYWGRSGKPRRLIRGEVLRIHQ